MENQIWLNVLLKWASVLNILLLPLVIFFINMLIRIERLETKMQFILKILNESKSKKN